MPKRVRRQLPPPAAASLPADLAPLPQYLSPSAITENPLDVELTRAALWHASGIISQAARLLDVRPARLLNFVKKSPYLQTERDKAAELLIDQAESVLADLLADDDHRADVAKWILERKGAVRGWGSSLKAPLAATNINFGKGDALVQIKWQDDSDP